MDPLHEHRLGLTRRQVFGRAGVGIGLAALASLLDSDPAAGATPDAFPGLPHVRPRAKRVISLFQSGAPSQIDLFDHKPRLSDLRGDELPDSVRRGQRLTGMTSRQASFPVAPSLFQFARHGQSGGTVSELLPYTAGVV